MLDRVCIQKVTQALEMGQIQISIFCFHFFAYLMQNKNLRKIEQKV